MGKAKILTEEQKNIILNAYVTEQRGQQYCAKQANCSIYMVKKFLKENNIKIRNFSEAAIQSNKNRSKKVNHYYFQHESSNMAWILGFIASDGCVDKDRNRIIINLSRADRCMLEEIRRELEIENEIVDYQNKDGYLCSSLSWTSDEHKKDLAKYNIIPHKTFKLIPPYKLNPKYYIDYIRGYFDGDGSVNLIKNYKGIGNGALRWQVAGAVQEMMEFIVNIFNKQYNIKPVKIYSRMDEKSTAPIYYIQYSSAATRKIYNILYTENSLYLKRKKEHYEEILKQIKPLNEIEFQETVIPL